MTKIKKVTKPQEYEFRNLNVLKGIIKVVVRLYHINKVVQLSEGKCYLF